MGFVKTGLGTSLGVVEVAPKPVQTKPEPKKVEAPRQADKAPEQATPKAQ